ncbi:DNA polymerase III subunit delta [Mycoplasmopsis cricetuli]|uniref:DNA polymerase III subunit delta n=1 Tax=Mycoplasmopsis cricetuli TaxID=171283 RepID=UPI0004727F3C|nr:hypothetical protein [Mycoplasmopsis cricetuli]
MILIYGEENYFIDLKINELKEKYSSENIVFFNEKTSFEEVTNYFYSNSLFDKKKLLIWENPEILIDKKSEKKYKKELLQLVNSIDDLTLNEIVFVVRNNNFHQNVLTKKLNELNKIYEAKKISKTNIFKEILKYLKSKNILIEHSDLIYLIEILPDNLTIIMQEIDKLIIETKIITRDIIDKSIGSYMLNDTFSFVNSFESGNLNEIFTFYKQRKYEGDEISFLISQMSSMFVLSNNIAKLSNLNWDFKKIALFLNVHEFRLKKAFKILHLYGENKIEEIILKLEKIDFQIKSTDINQEALFETFLIENFSKII